MSSAAAASPGGSLRPLSLAPRPLQLRSTSPSVAPSSTSNASTPTGTPKEGHVALSKSPIADNVSTSSRGPLVNGSVQRHQKRFSTLSYSSSPRSPGPTGFQSPIQGNFSENGEYESPEWEANGHSGVAKLPPVSLSRNSSRTWKAGNRNSMDVSLMIASGKRGSLSWERSEPGTPGSLDMSPALGRGDSMGDIRRVLMDEPSAASDASQEGGAFDSEAGPNANAVLTLAEKHAELLHFIAQKEAKCLELRTQLSQHEADLKALKTKWTSIIQKANPLASTSSGSGSLTMASAAVIRDGVGRLFSNVTAPLASALDALEPSATSASTPDQRTMKSQRLETDSPIIPDGASPSSYFPKIPAVSDIKNTSANGSRAHTPVSSNRSSASSFAVSRNSVSSNSSSLFEETRSSVTHDELGSESGDRVIDTSGTGSNIKRRTSTLRNRSISTEVTPNGTPALPESTPQVPNPLTSWTTVLSDLDASKLNKKWEEIQKGERFAKGSKRMSTLLSDVSTSFINTFAPPINEPLRPTKSRLASNSSSSPQTSRPSSSQTARPPLPASSSSKSLLDDDNELMSEMSASATTVHVMVPTKPSPSPVLMPSKPAASKPNGNSNGKSSQGTPEEEDDEEWNW